MSVRIGDATALPLPGGTVHLVVTSPPYNVGIDYGEDIDDDLPPERYEEFTRAWISEMHRVLVPGGRLAVVIGNINRKPYTRLDALVARIAGDTGFFDRGTIIWYKGDPAARSLTSWGSYKDCTNPVLRDAHEYILVFSRSTPTLDASGFPPADITGSEFQEASISVWKINPRRVLKWHPVPFPEEIPLRLVLFYTRPGMTVLDPFCGSGTTVIAATKLQRKAVGFDLNPLFVRKARKRLVAET